jgi:hypothetical protein
MNSKIYYGPLEPEMIVRDLEAAFHRGNYIVQRFGNPNQMAVQIATRRDRRSGGQTALTVTIQKIKDGVSVQLGNQAWIGVAASLGFTALSALRNPLSLIGRLDDIAQDIESSQLADSVMAVIENTARQHHASHAISERLRQIVCPFCRSGNAVGTGRCIACGAPIADQQPRTCLKCGYVSGIGELYCQNCGIKLPL